MENTGKVNKKSWTDEERLELAAKLDAELNEYINGLEKQTYTEGWPVDRWEEEMEKHPFFMKKCPEPGEELSPLVEGLQQLKYSDLENTPEELAHNYKEDGNFNYKYKKYRVAIISYTEGIRTKCKDQDLMAQLYNNRAASNFMLKNYRTSLNDSMCALKLKPDYSKALNRAAQCCLQIKDYDQCISLCDKFLEKSSTDKAVLSLRAQATSEKERLSRDKRKEEKLEKKLAKEEEKLLDIIKNKGINFELKGGKTHPNLKDLEIQIPQATQRRVHMDTNDKLVWPILILYPEMQLTDCIENFHEDTLLIDQLQNVFLESGYDTQYKVDNINVYYEGKNKSSIVKVNINKTLGEIIQDERFVIRCGAPTFIIFIKSSEGEKRFLKSY